ncbi:MAG: hypothetical protein WDN04_27190 [Rhodospirillales bacterium]
MMTASSCSFGTPPPPLYQALVVIALDQVQVPNGALLPFCAGTNIQLV